MHSVLILWAPETPENVKIVGLVAAAFEDAKLPTLAKPAGAVTIADITAAQVVVFGAQKLNSADAPPEYTECLRIFKGITLAGRTAGFFSFGAEKATSRLRKALKDTEIAQSEDDPIFSDQKASKPSEIVEWARGIARLHQEMVHARA
jgi:hypothetical protein